MPVEPMPPFNPNVPTSGGYSTNLTSQAAPQTAAPAPPALIFAGWTMVKSSTIPDYRVGPGGQGAEPVESESRQPTFLTIEQFMSRFDNSDREDFLKIRNMMIAAGIVPPGAEAYDVRNAFGNLLEQVAAMTATGAKMSPMGYVKNLIRMNGLNPGEIGSEADFGMDPEDVPFTGRMSHIERTVDQISEGEAFSVLQSSLSQMLGRAPTDQEIRNFTFKTNQLAAANPSITKVIEQQKAGDTVSVTRREIDTGLTPADIAQSAYDDAQSDPGYAEYQSATTYFNATMGALGAIGQT